MNKGSTWNRLLGTLAAGILTGSMALVGCAPKAPTATEEDASKPTVAEVSSGKKGEKIDPAAAAAVTPVPRDTLHQPFSEAVRNSDNPPADAERPPDETVTKKPVHRILEAVRTSWDNIRFTSASGKKLSYTAMVDTSIGSLQIALFPEIAPNHVRNFIALARAGYYDELFFDRARHEQNPTTNQEVHMLEAGCPLGTGESGTGSIGYWLKQEFTPADKMSHEEGIVGACRAEDSDTAATRFYINLTRAPFLDGNTTIFGKVIQGVDVLRKMAKEPTIVNDEGVCRPEKPIVIRKVTIVAQEVEEKK